MRENSLHAGLDQVIVHHFRNRLREAVDKDREGWIASRRLVTPEAAPETIRRLRGVVAESSLDPVVRKTLLDGLLPGETGGLRAVIGETLRTVTGLNPTKAIRNLCLLLDVGNLKRREAVSTMGQDEIETAIRGMDNPYDLLTAADVASVVDFGAGDLTFEEELVGRYLPLLEKAGRDFTLHCLDRLNPEEEFSPLVQLGRDRFKKLSHHPSPHFRFRFFGNQDMLDLKGVQTECPRYTISVCHSPASPTFAYEPSRIEAAVTQQHLRETKGTFRRMRAKGREVLEVIHGSERLTFPPWKFDIYGPLALLDLLSRTGKLCIMGAVDTEVFWEILSQLLPEERARPHNVFFTAENVRDYLGAAYEDLARLPVGAGTVLRDVRQDIPRVLNAASEDDRYGFRLVHIRRGALFPGLPAGKTAHVFDQMSQESPPWFLSLVPAT